MIREKQRKKKRTEKKNKKEDVRVPRVKRLEGKPPIFEDPIH